MSVSAISIRKRPGRAVLLAVLISACASGLSAWGQAMKGRKPGGGTVAALLAARAEDEKCHIFMRMRKGLSADDVLKIVGSEPSQAIAAMAVGCYLETGDADPGQAAAILVGLVERMRSYGLAATLGATSGRAAAIAGALADRAETGIPPRLAADMLATYATIRDGGLNADRFGKQTGRGGRRRAVLDPDGGAAAVLQRLLKSREPEVVETAILAAARLRLQGLQEAVDATGAVRTDGVAAARLLYAAKTGAAVNEATVQQVFSPEAKAGPPGGKHPPLFSYAIRTHALTYGCQALGELGDAKRLDHLHEALRHGDPHVRIDAARAIERIGSEKSLPPLLELVASPETDWPVLVHVLSAVGAIPSKQSIPVLIERLGKEKGRFQIDVNYALASIAGRQNGVDAKDWSAWWESNAATFAADRARTARFREENAVQDMRFAGGVIFYDLDIVSQNVVFVIDTSNSMRGEKIESAKKNLTHTLERLGPDVRFNVVNFGGVVQILRPFGLINRSHAQEAIAGVNYMELSLGTRAFDAMELAMSQPGADTIVLLTDGAPVAGKFCAWPRLIGALDVLTRYYPVAVWGLMFDPNANNRAAMKDMTGRNWGRSGSPQP